MLDKRRVLYLIDKYKMFVLKPNKNVDLNTSEFRSYSLWAINEAERRIKAIDFSNIYVKEKACSIIEEMFTDFSEYSWNHPQTCFMFSTAAEVLMDLYDYISNEVDYK